MMVTSCKIDSQSVVAVPKMNSVRIRKQPAASSNSNSSGFRLLDGDQLENNSSVSRNSIYKLKIDLMFDDSRSMRSNRLDDPRGSHRTRSIIMYGRSELASTAGDKPRSLSSFLQESSESAKVLAEAAKNDVQRISNSVQAQIEQLFTDVAKDATNSFDVTCLGCLPLKDKVTSLQGLQEPLRQLYLAEVTKKKLRSGSLDICATGLHIKISAMTTSSSSSNNINEDCDLNITPFHNIAVWSAVKFVISDTDGGAAFLPLITDPDNIDKTALFQPLSDVEQLAVEQSEHMHAPIFAVVMRSASAPKILECHGFICKSTEDAIVIAATLYQSLMAHVSTSSHRSTKRRTPRQQNGVSCISIASSSALTGSNYLSRSQIVPNGRRSSIRSSGGNSSAAGASPKLMGASTPSRSTRKKRVSSSSLSSNSNVINEAAEIETSTDERKRKSHKTKRAPPVPAPNVPGNYKISTGRTNSNNVSTNIMCSNGHVNRLHHQQNGHVKRSTTPTPNGRKISDLVGAGAAAAAAGDGDILTRVAIPRSGSFLNTGGLTRYKSRAARRTNSGKLGGGGGGSPLGFSELFNEFRLHENLHSLDDILYAIIDADGMSFNDLKPIYKEFLLKLAVTLTQDELFQRSKNIMRRQKKKKQKRKASVSASQKKPKSMFFGTKSLKKVFQLGQFRSCRGKLAKPTRTKDTPAISDGSNKRRITPPIIIGPPTIQNHSQQHQRNRAATSGSDVSVVRNEHALQGLNRNSSSGYVSCSECSYDSESCTCASADRCYCSLRTEHLNHKLRQKNERTMAMANSRKPTGNAGTVVANRHSLVSCKSDEKCYCSMVEEEPNSTLEHDSANTHSDTTTSCDTDSCMSASKCYCKRSHRRQRINAANVSEDSLNLRPKSRAATRKGKPSEKLGLDYELFTIGGNSKPVQPHEALSVKKSVEAAAVFADMKLSQTTDIKSLCSPMVNKQKQVMRPSNGSCRSFYRTRESFSTDRLMCNGNGMIIPLSLPMHKNGSQKTCSADDLLINIKALEKAASIRSSVSRSRMASYQSMRAVSASLEDSLGYLP